MAFNSDAITVISVDKIVASRADRKTNENKATNIGINSDLGTIYPSPSSSVVIVELVSLISWLAEVPVLEPAAPYSYSKNAGSSSNSFSKFSAAISLATTPAISDEGSTITVFLETFDFILIALSINDNLSGSSISGALICWEY
ncbi:unnamed protein product [[Candida] boidinii]|nr:unnamed protein product [[Candida] boidinii]